MDTNTSKKIIEISSLSKSFGDIHAVKEISFSVNRGELFAFLGVNGAGKSTTISIICGTLSKDSGRVTVDGFDIDTDADRTKSLIGVVFQSSLLDKALTVRDNLRSRAALYNIYGKDFDARLSELCEMLELDALLSRPVGKLSGAELTVHAPCSTSRVFLFSTSLRPDSIRKREALYGDSSRGFAARRI